MKCARHGVARLARCGFRPVHAGGEQQRRQPGKDNSLSQDTTYIEKLF